MAGPARKKEVGGRLVESHGVSERRACRVIAQPRSSQRYEAKDPQRDAALAKELRASKPNQAWSDDFVFDETTDGRRLKWLPVCDEFT